MICVLVEHCKHQMKRFITLKSCILVPKSYWDVQTPRPHGSLCTFSLVVTYVGHRWRDRRWCGGVHNRKSAPLACLTRERSIWHTWLPPERDRRAQFLLPIRSRPMSIVKKTITYGWFLWRRRSVIVAEPHNSVTPRKGASCTYIWTFQFLFMNKCYNNWTCVMWNVQYL